MATMKCLLWQPMVFVNGYHWFVRLHLVGSTVFTGLCGYIWWADDGYGEMSAWATHGVCHRVSLDCAATIGGPLGHLAVSRLGNSCHRVSLDCAATIGGPLGHLTVSRLGNS